MKKIISVVALSVLTLSAYAATKTQTVSDFTQLAVRNGFKVQVNCAKDARVSMTGTEEGLSTTEVAVHDGTLEIEHQHDFGSNDSVSLVINTAKPLTLVKVEDGVALKVAACAIDPNSVKLLMRNGSKVQLAGKTKSFDLELSKGATFGSSGGTFAMDDMHVKGSMGAKVYACHAKSVTGTLSEGAEIYVPASANTTGLNLSWGAQKKDC